MMWVAWRQHRASFLAAVGGLGLLAAFLIGTGMQMRHKFDALGLDACAAPISQTCPDTAHQFTQLYSGYQFLIPLLLILPVLAGVFWGAPLVAREVENGTHRLVWTQSISRRRWLAVKVGLLTAAAVIGMAAATLLGNWWTEPLMAVQPQRFDVGVFDLLGVVPVTYAIAALAIGVAAGTFTKKLIPAIALTVVAFLVVRVGVEFGLRPHYMSPVTTSVAFADSKGGAFPELPSDAGWVLSMETLDGAGRLISDGVGIEYRAAVADCPELTAPATGTPVGPRALAECAKRNDFHIVASYQPDDRYWRFQVTEAVIYLALSGALIALSAWWVRRRVS